MSADVIDAAARRRHWAALAVITVGVLMIMLDTTVVNVALPSIRRDLNLTETALGSVVNIYMLAFGGFLLLGGRLGDLYGNRTLFLVGVVFFTGASLMCGLAQTRGLLMVGRAVQGVGGALVVAVALSLTVSLFADPLQRAKALGVYASASGAGGSIGLLVGGVLTSELSWRWIFLVNLPVGIAVFVLSLCFVSARRTPARNGRLDLWGAVVLTGSLVLAIYAFANGHEEGWGSAGTMGLLACATLLMAAFVRIQACVRNPILPLSLFRRRNLMIAAAARTLWAAGAATWLFVAGLYMQLVLGYTPLEVAFAFLPANLVMAAFALGLSARLVARFGIRAPLGVGFLLGAIGLVLLARVPLDGRLTSDILPGMLLLGVGAGISMTPLLLASTSDEPNQPGAASGMVNTAALIGAALGLAILVSLSAAKARSLLATGTPELVALTEGYRVALLGAAACAGAAALIGSAFIRVPRPAAAASAESR